MDWYPWYPQLYQADTLHLTDAEDLAYRRIIDWYMAHRRPPPSQSQALANICRYSLENWDQVAVALMPFFKPKNGLLHLKRCDAELDRQDSRSRALSEYGKKGAEKRHDKSTPSKPSLSPSLGQTVAQDSNKTRQEERIEEARSPRGSRLPEDWQPNESDCSYASDLGLDASKIAENFRDYWLAKAGSGAVKLDWSRTWRTWCRKEAERAPKQNGAGRANGHDTVAYRPSGDMPIEVVAKMVKARQRSLRLTDHAIKEALTKGLVTSAEAEWYSVR